MSGFCTAADLLRSRQLGTNPRELGTNLRERAPANSSGHTRQLPAMQAPRTRGIHQVPWASSASSSKDNSLVDDSYPSIQCEEQDMLMIASRLVGRQFHTEGHAELLRLAGCASQQDVTLNLFVEREPENAYDPLALLVRAGSGSTSLSCGHVPREYARVLSPLIDDKSIELTEATVVAEELRGSSANAPVSLVLRIRFHTSASRAKQIRESVKTLEVLATPKPVAASMALSRRKRSTLAQQSEPLKKQRSLLVNFGRGPRTSSGNIATKSSSTALDILLHSIDIFPSIARQISLHALLGLGAVSQAFNKAVKVLPHLRLRTSVERRVAGSGLDQVNEQEEQVLFAKDCVVANVRNGTIGITRLVETVRKWAPTPLELQVVFKALTVAGEDEMSPATLLQDVCQKLNIIDQQDGWPALALSFWFCPTSMRQRIAKLVILCPGIDVDEVRELLALLVLLVGKQYNGKVGARRLHAELLVLNRLLESYVGLKLPIQGVHLPGGVQLTEEQSVIIARDVGPSEMLVVSAFAGTGKTSTLRMYATLRPHLSFLYLCFNVSVREEAQRTFPKNVTCRNAHQLAYGALGFRFKHKLVSDLRAEDLAGLPIIDEYVKTANKGDLGGAVLEAAEVCLATLQGFINSADVVPGLEHVPKPTPQIISNNTLEASAVCEIAARLWRRMCDPQDTEIRMTHGGYLKLYSLRRPKLLYDVVLLDEAQDCNPAIADIVASQDCARILVGDEHQSIYGFLGAQDTLRSGMTRSSGRSVTRRHLTKSFRFGSNIADLANFVLWYCKNEYRPLLGCGQHEGELLLNADFDEAVASLAREQFAFIARTNASVINFALGAHSEGRSLSWVGGVKSYSIGTLKDLCLLSLGQSDQAESARVKRFKSLQGLHAFAKRIDDKDMLTKIDLVRRHEPDVLLTNLEALERAAVTRERLPNWLHTADVVLSTLHKAKGLEWDVVLLGDDFADFWELRQIQHLVQNGAFSENQKIQEVHALYIAVTRAKRKLRPPSSMARLYAQQMQAVCLTKQLESRSPTPPKTCPFCGCTSYLCEEVLPGLFAVGSLSLEPLCLECTKCSLVSGSIQDSQHSNQPHHGPHHQRPHEPRPASPLPRPHQPYNQPNRQPHHRPHHQPHHQLNNQPHHQPHSINTTRSINTSISTIVIESDDE